MKKRANIFLVFAFVFLIVGLLSVGFVCGAGVSPTKKKCTPAPAGKNQEMFNSVGCDCETGSSLTGNLNDYIKGTSNYVASYPFILEWSRSNWEMGDDDREETLDVRYCYVDDPRVEEPSMTNKPGSGSGKGEVRMCTEDEYTEYYDTSIVPYSGEVRGNKECREEFPYCEDNLCNECTGAEDCRSSLKWSEFINNPKNGVKNVLCTPLGIVEYKACNFCVNTNGTGPQKIIIIVGGDFDYFDYSDVVNSIIDKEPFTYLYKVKNAFSFDYVYMPADMFGVDIQYETYASSGGKKNIRLSKSTEKAIVDYARDVCGDGIVIFIEGGSEEDYGYSNKDDNIFVADNPTRYSQFDHELGHSIGDLADEYVLPFSRSSGAIIERYGVNIQASGYTEISGVCPKFTNEGVDLQNCFDVMDDEGNQNMGYKKSTLKSIMNTDWIEPRFNVISCAGLLNQIGDIPLEQGVKYCSGKELAPNKNGNFNYNIGNGIIQQNA